MTYAITTTILYLGIALLLALMAIRIIAMVRNEKAELGSLKKLYGGLSKAVLALLLVLTGILIALTPIEPQTNGAVVEVSAWTICLYLLALGVFSIGVLTCIAVLISAVVRVWLRKMALIDREPYYFAGFELAFDTWCLLAWTWFTTASHNWLT